MIRRDAGADWLLIPQPEHARFAGEMAARWAAAPLIPRDSVVFATAHHDDGWIEWERAPRAEAGTGLPVDFLGVGADGIGIWERGARLVATHDPYAGILVSLHFCALVEAVARRRPPEERAAIEAFLRGQRAFRESVADAGAAREPSELERLGRNLRVLQILDYLSLVLCCGPATSGRVTTPGGDVPALTLSLEARGEREVALRPWPFEGDEIRGSVPAARLPKVRYDDRSLGRALAAAPREELEFRLVPVEIGSRAAAERLRLPEGEGRGGGR
jgi:hypothetical protein